MAEGVDVENRGFFGRQFPELVNEINKLKSPHGWYGDMLDAHTIKLGGEDPKLKLPEDGYGHQHSKVGRIGTNPDPFFRPVFNEDLPFSKRATMIFNNDPTTDYFLHDTHISSPYNSSVFTTYDDYVKAEAAGQAQLAEFSNTSWENQDPVIYGFEVIIDAISSPLLNGGVEDFLDLFSNVNEIEARRRVLYDFKQHFEKLFKTRGSIRFRDTETQKFGNDALFSDVNGNVLNKYAHTSQPNSGLFRFGRKAYLSHYLNKIEGLHKLQEANLGETMKYYADYRKDFIKLSFNEDVSGTLSALSHLYKLLYFSKSNQKGMVPENLLRFNCEIIVSEVRSFNRIRNYMKQQDVGNNEFKLQVIKDNVSRYVYSLRECQFYFDTPAHDDSIDYSQSGVYAGYTVNFDYKYSSLKYEKWVSDPDKFGRYVSYHNGALWKFASKGGKFGRAQEEKGLEPRDYSNPKFYSVGANTFAQNGVDFPIELMNYRYQGPPDEDEEDEEAGVNSAAGTVANTNEDDPDRARRKKRRKKRREKIFGGLWKVTKRVGVRTAKASYETVKNEVSAQIGVRYELLKNTVRKIGNLTGITNMQYVYPRPYTPVGMGIFFDVRNELYNFWGEEISTIMANAQGIANPFAVPAVEGILPKELKKKDAPSVWFNPLNQLLKKYSDIPSIISDGQPANLQSGIVDGKYNYPVQFPLGAQKSSNTVKSEGNLKEILDGKAVFKPKNEGDGTKGSYLFKDPQQGTTINVPSVTLPGVGSIPAFTLTLPGFGPNTSVKEKPGGLEKLLDDNAKYNKPMDQKKGSYIFKDPQAGVGGAKFGPDSSVKENPGGLEKLLDDNANYNKPMDQKKGSYIFKDPQVGVAGAKFGPDSSVKEKPGGLEALLNDNANFKPKEEGDGTAGSYKFFDPQEPKAGTNYPVNTQGAGFGFSALGKQSVDAKNTKINDLLNKNATINKPSDQGIGISSQTGLYYVTGAYTFYDPNKGFGGAAVPQSSDNVKSMGSLKNILDAYANFKPKEEGDGTAGSYTFLDPQEPKAGTNYPSTSPKGVGFGFSGLGKQSVDAKNASLNSLLNDNSIDFKPKDDAIFKDYNINFGGMGGQGIKAQGSLEAILNSGAVFKPADEGVSAGKLSGKYNFKDPNVGFGGAAVPQSSENVKSQGSLEDIVKKNTKWPYPFNDKKFPRDI